METTTLSFGKCFSTEQYTNLNGIHVSKGIASKSLKRPIFRYMSAEYLLTLLKSNKLYLGNRLTSEDLNEHGWNLEHVMGALCPVLRNKKEQNEYAKKAITQWNDIHSCCISCWTYDTSIEADYSSENYFMWKNYTGKNGIRITSTCSDLIQSINNKHEQEIILSDVTYLKEMSREFLPQEMIFTKRDFYRDEREMRLCVLNNSNHILLDINSQQLIKQITLSPFMPPILRQILKNYLENTYQWLQGKISNSKICTNQNFSLYE